MENMVGYGEVQTKAPLDSPALTGTPTALMPETTAGIEIATAAFVVAVAQCWLVLRRKRWTPCGRNWLTLFWGNDPNFAITVLNKLAGVAPLDLGNSTRFVRKKR